MLDLRQWWLSDRALVEYSAALLMAELPDVFPLLEAKGFDDYGGYELIGPIRLRLDEIDLQRVYEVLTALHEIEPSAEELEDPFDGVDTIDDLFDKGYYFG